MLAKRTLAKRTLAKRTLKKAIYGLYIGIHTVHVAPCLYSKFLAWPKTIYRQIDLAFTLKKTLKVDLKLCIFCQKHDKSNESLKESKRCSCMTLRLNDESSARDVANREVSDRLDNLLATNQEESSNRLYATEIVWVSISFHNSLSTQYLVRWTICIID